MSEHSGDPVNPPFVGIAWRIETNDPMQNAVEELEKMRRGTDALREAFGPELWALGHPAYVVTHLRDELDKVTRLWKRSSIELTASRERVERLQTGIREVIPEIFKYVGHIPDRKFTIGNVIRKLEALAATAGEVKP